MSTIVIVLTSGTKWTVPGDCSSAKVEGIGGGGNGSSATFGSGGKGGCYACRNTILLTPGEVKSYGIGVGGGATGAGTSPSANTWFGDASTLVAAGADSTTTNCVGDVVHAGGAGGTGGNNTNNGAPGGGGAGGPHGAGNNGVSVTTGVFGKAGGSGDAGFGGAGGAQRTGSATGNPGSPGAEWTSGSTTAGSGGGGSGTYVGGTSNANTGGAGGLYGGAGGSAFQKGGVGAPGLIVITYTPQPQVQEDPGSFALTGSDAAVAAEHKLSEATGSFEITGSDLGAERKLDAETGTFSLHGSDADLDAPVRHLDGDSGSFDLTGHAAGTQAQHREPEGEGAFALTGSHAQPSVNRELPEEPGSFGITGKAAKLAGVTPPSTPVALLLAAAVAGNAPVLGCYTVPDDHIYDLGYVGTLNLSENWVASGDAITDDFFAPADFFGQNDVFNSAAAAQIVSWVEVNIGVPNGNGGIAWNGWQKFSAGSYPGRYVKRRCFVQSPSPQIVGTLLKLADQCSVPVRIDHYQDLSIPADGLTIAFTPDGLTTAAAFNAGPNGAALPFVSVTYNNQSGDTLLLSALSKTSVTIQILNAGVGGARSGVNVAAEGY